MKRFRPGASAAILGFGAALALGACHKANSAAATRPPHPPVDRAFLETCQSCHGVEGATAGDPPRPVPRLFGQQQIYLATALRAYRAGSRQNPTMQAMAAGLTDDQIAVAAQALSGAAPRPPPPTHEPPAPVVVQGVCAGCHGQTGLSTIPEYPMIGGQKQDYLKAALEDYRAGRRANPAMQVFARGLSADQTEIVTAYFAARNGLKTAASPPERRP